MRRSHLHRLVAAGSVAAALGLATACGESTGAATAQPTDTAATVDGPQASVSLVSPDQAADLLVDRSDLIVIDVRTPAEHDEAHLSGATLIDFYEPDFAERLSELDRDTGYVVYCRSGNRSGRATALMSQLGFTEVYDVDGGIQSWAAAGLPTETG